MIKRLFLLLVTALCSWSASAADTYYFATSNVKKFGPTQLAACQLAAASISYTSPFVEVANGVATCRGTSQQGIVSNVATVYGPVTCPGSTPYFNYTTGVCTATAPPPPPPTCAVQDAGDMNVTVAYATGPDVGSALAKIVVPDGGIPASGNPNLLFCAAGCIVAPSGGPKWCKQAQVPGPNGYYKIYCLVPMQQNGSECGSNPPPGPDTAPEPGGTGTKDGKCPAGSIPTGVDSSGMTICTGTQQPPPPPVTKGEKPPVAGSDAQGNPTSTKENTQTNADGSTTTTTTTTTTKPDGSTSTTVTMSTTPLANGSPGHEDTPEDKNDLCKRNPQLNICKNSQVMGTCGTVTCQGDAIQCATLRAAAAMECRDKADRDELGASPHLTLAKQMLAGQDPLALPTKANGSTVALPGSLDQSGWLGGGSFFPDKTFQVQGKSVTIPFSQVGPYLLAFRYAMMIVAFLVAFRILSGAIIRE